MSSPPAFDLLEREEERRSKGVVTGVTPPPPLAQSGLSEFLLDCFILSGGFSSQQEVRLPPSPAPLAPLVLLTVSFRSFLGLWILLENLRAPPAPPPEPSVEESLG